MAAGATPICCTSYPYAIINPCNMWNSGRRAVSWELRQPAVPAVNSVTRPAARYKLQSISSARLQRHPGRTAASPRAVLCGALPAAGFAPSCQPPASSYRYVDPERTAGRASFAGARHRLTRHERRRGFNCPRLHGLIRGAAWTVRRLETFECHVC